MSWTAPRTWTLGELVTASMLNTHVRDNLIELRAGGLAISGQLATRIPYAISATQLEMASTLTWDGTTLTASNFSGGAYSGNSYTGKSVLFTGAAAGTDAGPSIWGFSNTLFFVAGTSGFVWNNQNNTANLATLGTVSASTRLTVLDTSAGTTSFAELGLIRDGSLGLYLDAYSSTFTTSGPFQASGGSLLSDGSAGMSYVASHASGAQRFYTGGTTLRGTMHASGGLSWGDATDPGSTNFRVAGTSALVGAVTGGLYNGQTISSVANFTGSLAAAGVVKSSAQPGFLAYNSVGDTTQSNGATIDFDTEVYDELGNFSGDTFTAPVTGRYLFSAAVSTLTGSAAQLRILHLQTSNRTYRLDGMYMSASGVGGDNDAVLSGSAIADMDAGDTATCTISLTGATTCTIDGHATALMTHFSGRLLV